MNQKKIIEQLVKIAEKQQKLINKLAQQRLGDPGAPPPPQSLPTPPHPNLDVGKTVLDALPPQVKPAIKALIPKGDTLEVSFAGAPNQAALDAVTHTVQKLLNAKPPILPFAYKVVPV